MARKEPPKARLIYTHVPDPKKQGASAGFCLLNTMLLLTASTALVALVVKGGKR